MASGKQTLVGLFSIWLCVVCSSAQENSTEPANITVSTEPPEFSITLLHLESSTDTIKFNWTVPPNYEVTYSRVKSNRIDSDAVTTSPDLTETEYTIEDLRRDTSYNVCVSVYNKDSEYDGSTECETYSTIRLMRDDSLLALFAVIGFLLLCILGGYLCWKYQQSKAAAKQEEAEEGENAKLNNANGPPLSIEDNDIPFITPPPDELTPDERKAYDAAAKA
jgi:hypothetical protein